MAETYKLKQNLLIYNTKTIQQILEPNVHLILK